MMRKYPSVYTIREFSKLLNKYPEILDLKGYVEPKYDGSNITVFDGEFRTRNLNPLPANFAEGLRIALGDKLGALIELSRKYQVFFELGGTRNSPAGYGDGWDGEWDYRVFDMMDGSVFLRPEEVVEICDRYGLKFVGYEVVDVRDVIENWRELLRKFNEVEGFVLKIYPPEEVLDKIRYHRQYNVILAKFKHENLSEKPVTRRSSGSSGKDSAPVLPASEILGVINRAHLILGDDIYDKRRAMQLISKLVEEEARKHGYRAPKASVIYRYYRKYIEKTRVTASIHA